MGPDQIEHDSVSRLKTKTQNSPTYKAGGRQCKRRRQRRLRSREDHRQSSLWSSSRPQRWSRSILSARRGCAVEAAPRSLSLLDTPSLEHTHTRTRTHAPHTGSRVHIVLLSRSLLFTLYTSQQPFAPALVSFFGWACSVLFSLGIVVSLQTNPKLLRFQLLYL